MAQMNISIPEGLKAWAEQRVAEGRYASTSDYVRDLIRRDEADAINALRDVRQNYRVESLSETERAWIDEAIEEGLASSPSKRSVAEIMARQRRALG
ncbi:ribbon-helix-helix domain-containing protein [Sphingobium boeckii]|uniref:Antitoxin ParD1/3/4 n=1 Tax=Sphingobium boeckii TaxID=1082345 RepID=A0A7W9AH60_9SPHN|nr:type II toxin-antitoxin system ParD family antitoxin [Sphingobium boeckii]MBB5685321.1 antitoxin ParD1/3/4 [Sphingobium boeckii]